MPTPNDYDYPDLPSSKDSDWSDLPDESIDKWNIAWRSSPLYRRIVQRMGLNPDQPGGIHLTEAQRLELQGELEQASGGRFSGHDVHIDRAGNMHGNSSLLKRVLIGAGIAGAALTGAGAFGIGPLSGLAGSAADIAAPTGLMEGAGEGLPALAATQIGEGAIPGLTLAGGGLGEAGEAALGTAAGGGLAGEDIVGGGLGPGGNLSSIEPGTGADGPGALSRLGSLFKFGNGIIPSALLKGLERAFQPRTQYPTSSQSISTTGPSSESRAAFSGLFNPVFQRAGASQAMDLPEITPGAPAMPDIPGSPLPSPNYPGPRPSVRLRTPQGGAPLTNDSADMWNNLKLLGLG